MTEQSNYLFKSGDLFLPDRVRKFLETFIYGSYKNTFYLTYWSVLHLISGLCVAYVFKNYYVVKHPYWVGFWIHNVWELWQIMIGMSKPLTLVGHNNLIDSVVDTILFMIGMWVVLGWKN